MGKFLDTLGKIGSAVNPIVGLGLSLFNSLSNRKAQERANQQERQFALDMYNRQRSDALTDFQMQNAYNTPAAQMQRYKDAGLNPHLIYGQTPTASASVKSSTPGSFNPKISPMAVAADLSQYQDTALKAAQIDNLKTQNVIQQKTIELKALEIIGKDIQNKTGDFKLGKEQALLPLYVETQRALLNKILAETEQKEAQTSYVLTENERRTALTASNLALAAEKVLNLRKDRAKSDAEIRKINAQIEVIRKDKKLKELEINLREKGIQPGDPAWLRVLTQYLQNKSTFGGKVVQTPTPEKTPWMNPLKHIFGNFMTD